MRASAKAPSLIEIMRHAPRKANIPIGFDHQHRVRGMPWDFNGLCEEELAALGVALAYKRIVLLYKIQLRGSVFIAHGSSAFGFLGPVHDYQVCLLNFAKSRSSEEWIPRAVTPAPGLHRNLPAPNFSPGMSEVRSALSPTRPISRRGFG